MKAQAKVREDGYFVFKKGFSRSLSANGKPNPEPKRKKQFKEERIVRMKEVNDNISEIKKMIVYKEQRRNKCVTTKEWHTCETISTEIRKLVSEKSELERERLLLARKEKKADWYQKRKASETPDSPNMRKIRKSASSSTNNAIRFPITSYCSTGSLKDGTGTVVESVDLTSGENDTSKQKEVPSEVPSASCDVSIGKDEISALQHATQNCADSSKDSSSIVEISKNSQDLAENVGSSIQYGSDKDF